jgi:hypothetical protein
MCGKAKEAAHTHTDTPGIGKPGLRVPVAIARRGPRRAARAVQTHSAPSVRLQRFRARPAARPLSPFTTDTLRCCSLHSNALYTHSKSIIVEHSPPKDHPQPWIQDGLKGDSRAAASPCRLRTGPRCRGGGSRGRRGDTGVRVGALVLVRNRFGVMCRKVIAQIQDTVGSCGNDACTYPVRGSRPGEPAPVPKQPCSAPLTCAH